MKLTSILNRLQKVPFTDIISGMHMAAAMPMNIMTGSATYFGDWKTRHEFLRTAEIAGNTKKEKEMRHYQMSELFLVGEASALAMRTNVKR